MSKKPSCDTKTNLSRLATLIAIMAIASAGIPASAAQNEFGPSNPFYAESTLPFHAPPFDKIKDSDYQPAIEAGMAKQREKMKAIADNPAPPTFENTIVAMEKTGRLFDRAMSAFGAVTGSKHRSWPPTPMPSSSIRSFFSESKPSTNNGIP
jgi:hypothetical protein